jgi:hypothetical protein
MLYIGYEKHWSASAQAIKPFVEMHHRPDVYLADSDGNRTILQNGYVLFVGQVIVFCGLPAQGAAPRAAT